ncbi:hypothetical protein A2379_03690 [Candidatus Amesbacteria bacterium RIFOXYB1_FULL_47_13]|nr:MAG: hypothetical protein A2379_03690 [Candidatus Amesbacteria bacterium RIFOXYB1_FULL_47_13]
MVEVGVGDKVRQIREGVNPDEVIFRVVRIGRENIGGRNMTGAELLCKNKRPGNRMLIFCEGKLSPNGGKVQLPGYQEIQLTDGKMMTIRLELVEEEERRGLSAWVRGHFRRLA